MALTQIKAAGIAADAIDETKIADNGIDSEHYNDASIDTAHIANDQITNALMADDAIGIAQLSATGTASSSTYLRGDNSWATVSTGVTSDDEFNTKAGTNAGDSFNGTNATDNTLYGYDAGTAITDGDDNTFIGYQAGAATTEQSLHTAIGHRALASHNANAASSQSGNTAVGWGSMMDSTSAYNTTAVGKESMENSVDGYNNTMIGYYAAHDGFQSGNGHDNVGMGPQCFNSATSANYNIGIGGQALEDLTTGDYNTVGGWQAGMNITEGGGNTVLGYYAYSQATTGEHNIAIGNGAMSVGVTTGDNNVCVGRNAGNSLTGSENTFVGKYAGYNNTSGDNNVCLGHEAGKGQMTTHSDLLYIARGPEGSGNAACWIHGASNGDVSNGTNSSSWTTYSDQRLKKNITDNTDGLSIIDNVKVRNFKYKQYNATPEVLYTSSDTIPSGKAVGDVKTAKSWSPVASEDTINLSEFTDTDNHGQVLVGQGDTTTHVGIIAQELEAVCADCVKVDRHGVKTVNTDELFWHMIVAIKELSAKVKTLEAG